MKMFRERTNRTEDKDRKKEREKERKVESWTGCVEEN